MLDFGVEGGTEVEIYLDNAATSYPKPEAMPRAVHDYLVNIGVSSGRGAYRKALQADKLVFETRKRLASLFNVKDTSRIVFTLNVTESLNLALKGMLKPGDHVVTTSMEHNAMWRPLKVLEEERGITLTAVPCPQGNAVKPEDVEKAITPQTRLVAVTHASNVTGTLMPLEDIGIICRKYNVPLLLDAAQTAGVYPVDVEKLNIDLLAFTGHKGLLGPNGTGGLFIASGIDLAPLKEGGTGEESLLEHQPLTLPDRFEAGTPNITGIAGLGAALQFILDQGVEDICVHEESLTAYALERLPAVPGITIYGPQSARERVAVISFNLEDIAPEEVGYVLDEAYGIMVRAGLHCSPCAHRCLGTVDRGAVRISFGYFNTHQEIDRLVEALIHIVEA